MPAATPVTLGERHAALVGDLLGVLTVGQRHLARRPYDDSERRDWSYLPGERRGLALHLLGREQVQAALRLLAAALRPHAYAQAAAVMALEDVLDLQEGGSGRRHRGDYYVTVYGEPTDDRWGWRFEGHHVSVNVTAVRGELRVAPLFLGANPAAVEYGGLPVLAPLAPEEEVARALLDALDAPAREAALGGRQAPPDIRTGRRPQLDHVVPEGVPAVDLPPAAAALLHRLVGIYLDLYPAPIAAQHHQVLADGGWDVVHFSWHGDATPGRPHYYQVTGPRLLVEYDNTQNGANHAHSVLRDPQGDFGRDLLAEHYATYHR